MRFAFKGYWLYAVVVLVAVLILADLYLIHRNNNVITYNKDQQDQAERVKLSTSGVIRSLHLMDMAIRSYAFVNNDHFKAAMDSAVKQKNEAFFELEGLLKVQNYQMERFYALRDSTEAYVVIARQMVDMIDRGDHESFRRLLELDPGYRVWLLFQTFASDVHRFEDDIAKKASERYDQAISDTYLLQIILFIIAVPVLTYTALQTNKTLSISERLRKSEHEKTAILEKQNQVLERTVHERTKEILAQNEQIIFHNERLREAKAIIEDQNRVISEQNDELAEEVKKQTLNLIQANTELIQHNQRLEQFAFIISHNLRAPMSRIVGLASLLDFSTDASEVLDIARLMSKSTQELDLIIKDLNEILGVQKTGGQTFSEVPLEEVTTRALSMLETEIEQSAAVVNADFSAAKTVKGITSYVESIFYNLISNAIKYRHPGRNPEVKIMSRCDDGNVLITVTDNGLGINETHQQNLFDLYKRFHFHVDGRGIGLYLVKTQMTALGGNVEISSKEGEGTSFLLLFKNFSPDEVIPS